MPYLVQKRICFGLFVSLEKHIVNRRETTAKSTPNPEPPWFAAEHQEEGRRLQVLLEEDARVEALLGQGIHFCLGVPGMSV